MTKKITLVAFALILLAFAPVGNKYKAPKSFVFIPANKVTFDSITASHAAFFMLDHEITNLEYLEFLLDFKNSATAAQYALAYPDTAAWNIAGASNEPLATHYFSHPAYRNYPVVNVSKEGIEFYCVWLTQKLQTKYGNHINHVRLPTKCEWISAARGGNPDALYPWGTTNLVDNKGNLKANFYAAENVAGDAFYTAPVSSYKPNPFGLYNMCGNVAELIADGTAMGGHWASSAADISIVSEIAFEKSNPFVGFRPIMTYTAVAP